MQETILLRVEWFFEWAQQLRICDFSLKITGLNLEEIKYIHLLKLKQSNHCIKKVHYPTIKEVSYFNLTFS